MLVYRDGARDGSRDATKPAARSDDFSTLLEAREAYERDYILKKLDECGGNVTRAAEALGLERSHLYRKMKALGVNVKE
jgi:two-component system nitrogen regulation response regulator NtrX